MDSRARHMVRPPVDAEASASRALLTSYRVRTVRIGVQTTLLAVAALAVFALLPGHGDIYMPGFVALVAAALAGAGLVALLPWQRLFDRGFGVACLYAWSVADIVLITFAVGISGGSASELYLLYALTTIFFAASYPPRGQAVLLAFTFACYLMDLVAIRAPLSPAPLFMRLATLGMTAYMGSFLSRRLFREMVAHHAAKLASDRRAGLLVRITTAARRMNMLEPERLLGIVAEALIAQGFDATCICIFDAPPAPYRVASAKGHIDAAPESRPRALDALVDAVRRAGAPVVAREGSAALPSGLLEETGLALLVAGPVWSQGKLAAVLVGAARHALPELDLEALELLAAQAGRALENADYTEGLRRSERRFRSLVQNAVDVVMVMDAAATIHYASPPVSHVLGYEPEALLGMSSVQLIHPDDLPRVQAQFAEIVEQAGAGRTFELRARHGDGSWRWEEVTITNLLGEPSVAGVVVNFHDITERVSFQEELTRRAFHDPLTGLPNRAAFRQRLEQALAHADRRPGDVAVLFIDLDRFKVVNDSLGHETGDQLLVAVAERLRGRIGAEDTVARLGGDEFTVLLEEVSDAGVAVRLADDLLAALQAPFVVGARELVVTASIGIALRSSPATSADDLLRHADLALYRAKDAGRGRYEVFDAALGARATQRLELEADLRRALDSGELRVFYQPQVCLETGRLTGAEALARWQHPGQGLVGPDRFIPIAEETGLILPLGRWILVEACRQTRAWQIAAPNLPLQLSVNVSARQFGQARFVQDVYEALQETGMDPCRLTLEITETALIQDADAAVATLRALAALGVRLAIDDFGTGYSSLGYLRRYAIDIVKIDRSFVRDVATDPDAAALVEGILVLGRLLRLEIIAEGVETEEQRARLRGMGCAAGQGYLFARPLPAEAFAVVLSQAAAGARWSAEPTDPCADVPAPLMLTV